MGCFARIGTILYNFKNMEKTDVAVLLLIKFATCKFEKFANSGLQLY